MDCANNSSDGYKKHNLTCFNGMHAMLWQPGSIGMVRGICLVVVSVLGAGFNTFMIVAIVPNRKLRTVRSMLLVHLGAVGLVSSVSTTIYPALATFHSSWIGGVQMCQVHAYLTCLLTSVSVWTIAALSWDKYQTIASPLHHSLSATVKKILPCFSVLWLCGVILLLPPLFEAEFFVYSPMRICGLKFSTAAGRWYISIIACLSFIVPLCLMIYCYTHIFRIARTQSSRIAATMFRMASLIQAPIATASHGSNSLNGIKAMGTIFKLLGSFLLSYFPYATIVLYEVISSAHANATLVSISSTLFLAAPFTHAAIYGIKNPILRSSFRRYARRKVQHWCTRDNRRSNSIRYLARKRSTSIKVSIKCTVQSDEKQCILQRTVYCQNKPLDDQKAVYENKASSLPLSYGFDIVESTNNWPPLCAADIELFKCLRQHRDTDHVNMVPFIAVQDVAYIHPDYISRASSQEVAACTENSIKDAASFGSRIETSLTYSHEKLEHSSLDELVDGESDYVTDHDELIQLYPLKVVREGLDSKQSTKKIIQSSGKLKYGQQNKKSKQQWKITGHEDISVYGVEHIEAESRFEQ